VILQEPIDSSFGFHQVRLQQLPLNMPERDAATMPTDFSNKIFSHATIKGCWIQSLVP